jgi:hypothetical protein
MVLLRPGVPRPPTLSPTRIQGFSDRRTHDSRESAISVLTLAEKASHAVCRNGVGFRLMMQFYAGEASWWSFTEPEQAILRKTIRHFSKALREAGFLPKEFNHSDL